MPTLGLSSKIWMMNSLKGNCDGFWASAYAMLTQLQTMSGAYYDDHEGVCCEMIFPLWFRSMHGAYHETIVLAWPQMMCGACHDDHDGAHYEMNALGWLWTTHGVCHDGDAAKGQCGALKILQRKRAWANPAESFIMK